jgi:hypothetical protein
MADNLPELDITAILTSENARLLMDAERLKTELRQTREHVLQLQVAVEEAELAKSKARRESGLACDAAALARQGQGVTYTLPDFTGKALAEEAQLVTQALRNFLKVYWLFKRAYNLPHTFKNPFEMVAGLADKVGRVSRLVKHNMRNDPLPNAPTELEACVFGSIAYLVLLTCYYDIDMNKGVTDELVKAVMQHGEKAVVSDVRLPAQG